MISWWLRTCVVPPWALHERSPYLRVAARLERERKLSLAERQERQWRALQAIVRHAWQESPFYRRRFGEAGFEPGDLRTWDDLRRLPILTKQDVRTEADALVARSHAGAPLLRKRTSGSTGVSLHVQVDDVCNERRRGVTLFRDRWTGWNLGEYRAAIWGNPPPAVRWRQRLRSALLERTFYLDTLRMDEAMLRQFAESILVRKPTLLWGHAHSLALFAQYWEEHYPGAHRFKGVLSTAMVLHRHERETIERVFGTRVFDRYGCEEVSLIASECESHSGLHVNTDALVVEIDRRDSEPAGHILVTDLWNQGMPFIRYEVGDRGVEGSATCDCGRTYPLLASVTGRVADYLWTPRGERVSGISLTENFATLIPGVRQVQILQDHLTQIVISVVPDVGFGDGSRNAIAALVEKRFGPEMAFAIELVETIPQEPSGKYRFTICRIPDAEVSAFRHARN
ncbi:MAG TPA: phenylacetate--CoA ligase family protein [Candidatus Krumholzibacteria bacterium]|nr:phenylacetate--CoA ligase family protein [Candidatus Krumholzibacteria bacterium]